MRKIYYADIHVRGMPGSGLAKFSDGTGAFTCVFVPASSEREAREIIEKEMIDEKLDLVELERIESYDELEFDENIQQKYDKHAREALEKNHVMYGEFNSYP